MKKLLTLFSCFLLFATVSNAQNEDSVNRAKEHHKLAGRDSSGKQKFKDKGNLKSLNLSKDQEKQIDDFRAKAKQDKEKVLSDSSLTETQKQEKIKTINADLKSKTHSVLTQEQRDKIKQKRAGNKNTDSTQ